MTRTKSVCWTLLSVALAVMLAASAANATLLINYKFDESPSGNTTATDSSGYSHTGTFALAPSRSTTDLPALPGGNVSSVSLNNSAGNYVSTASASDLVSLRSMTIMMWVKDTPVPLGSGNSYPRIMEKISSTSGLLASFNLANNVVGLELRASPSVDLSCNSTTYGTLTGWHNFAITWDGTYGGNSDNSGLVSFYLDGQLLGSPQVLTGTGLDVTPTETNPFTVANNTVTHNRALGNLFDDFRFYGSKTDGSGALTQAQIQELLVVPEPSALMLVGIGMFGMIALRRFRHPSAR